MDQVNKTVIETSKTVYKVTYEDLRELVIACEAWTHGLYKPTPESPGAIVQNILERCRQGPSPLDNNTNERIASNGKEEEGETKNKEGS